MRFRTKQMLVFSLLIALMCSAFLVFSLGFHKNRIIAEAEYRRSSLAIHLHNDIINMVYAGDVLQLTAAIRNICNDVVYIDYIFVIGDDGHLLAHTFDTGFPSGLFNVNLLPADKPATSRLLLTNKGRIRDFATRMARHTQGEIHVGMNEEVFYKQIGDSVKMTVIMTIVCLSLGLFLVYAISAYLSKPLENLELGMKKTENGDLEYRLEEKGDYEILNLLRSYNRMTESILDSNTRLQQAKEKIEKFNFLLHAIRNINQLITRKQDRACLLRGACDNLIDVPGLYSAWITVLDESGASVTFAEAGFGEDFLLIKEMLHQGELPACGQMALKQPDVLVTEDPASTCTNCPLKERCGDLWRMSVRLEHGGNIYGLLTVTISKDVLTKKQEQNLLKEIAGDIAFALHAIKLEEKHKQADAALIESESKFRTLVEKTPAIIYTAALDEYSTTQYISPQIETILGFTQEEFKANNDIWDKQLHPDDRNRVLKETAASHPNDIPFASEYRMLTKTGRTVWFRDEAVVEKNEAGEPLFVQGVMLDITRRKQAEEALQNSEERLYRAVEGNSLPTFLIDSNHIITHWNKSCEKLTGISAAEIVGTRKTWSAFYAEERPVLADLIVNEATGEEIDRYYEGKYNKSILTEGAYECEDFFPDLGEKGKWLLITASPLQDRRGKILGAIETFHDITRRKSMEEEFRQAQKMEAIGVLAGGVAHDFNNLLTVILGNTQLALMDVITNESLRKKIEEIKKAGDRAASVTRQLVAFSRKQIIRPEVLDLNKEINETKKMLKRMIGEDVEFQTVLKPELWKVRTDPGQINQVIMNMVINARHAMPQGGRLIIETANADLDESYFREHGIKETPGHYVMLAISDTGSGMDKETRKHIFEPFFTSKKVGKGTGLGLSTVYGIVKQNNGFIWVYSEPEQGTTFKIYLPEVKAYARPKKKEQTPVNDPGGSETVLIAEDDDSLRSLAQNGLRQYGYKVLVAENGEDALNVGKKHEGEIHLLLTDVIMPKIGGKEAADRLQALYPQIKVIYMSGYTDNAIVHYGVLAPGLNFLEKPFTPEILAQKVREVLDAG